MNRSAYLCTRLLRIAAASTQLEVKVACGMPCHPDYAFDAEMSGKAIKQLNAAIGSRTIPLKTQVYAFKDVVEAHRRIEEGHVVGKIVLRIGS